MNATLLEWSAALLSLAGVWLMTRRVRLAWPVGLVSVGLYALVFVEARLYSDTLLQIAFGGFLVYGWINWRGHLEDDGRVGIVALPRPRMLRDLGVGVVFGAVLGALMHAHTQAALPWLDALLAALSLVAQWWQARRHAAAWWLWIAVDLVYVGMYLVKSLHVTAALYLVFTAVAVIGLRAWNASARQAAVA
ncbi:nicotinamide riboside transporter PnuC [Xanthomonas sp. 60]